jgi:GNAT superfamily N-acetyltransferase
MRDAEPGDAAAIADLLDVLGYPAMEDEARGHIERFSADPASRLQVAVDEDDRPVGLVATHLIPRLNRELRTCRVTELVVDPSWRRAGVGRALITAAEDEARLRGATLVDLTSGDWREEAHGFYPEAGFERVGVGYLRRLGPS